MHLKHSVSICSALDVAKKINLYWNPDIPLTVLQLSKYIQSDVAGKLTVKIMVVGMTSNSEYSHF